MYISFIYKDSNDLFSTCSVKPFTQGAYTAAVGKGVGGVPGALGGAEVAPPPPWEGRAIATHKLRLVEFSAYMEQQRDQETVRIHYFMLKIFIKVSFN